MLLPLPGDAPSRWSIPALWDNNINSDNGFHSSEELPKRFQFDLGERAKLSRFRIWGIRKGREYSSGNLREFEIGGSDDQSRSEERRVGKECVRTGSLRWWR